MTCRQLMHSKAQMSTSTTRPRSPAMVSGAELIQLSVCSSGAAPSTGKSERVVAAVGLGTTVAVGAASVAVGGTDVGAAVGGAAVGGAVAEAAMVGSAGAAAARCVAGGAGS